MKHRPALLALAISLALAPMTQAAEGKNTKTYKWVDDHGVTHYGDTVPPEFAKQGRSELNAQGVELRQLPRQLTPEEADVAQKKAAEEARRRQHDSFLLTTYTKVTDIEQLRDERVALIDGQMEIARGSIESNQQRLKALETRLRSFAPYSTAPTARRVPDQLAEEVVRTMKERDQLRDALRSREKEKAELRAQFDADIARYRELTTRPAGR
ncbi:MAG TPA: DUF4124 domain-containing protein [Steroidobacteraceae bacterium]|nr:DUF4124 domain-containing protein [Steroidobacteraceae bacterium]